jgi:hypothetical protein
MKCVFLNNFSNIEDSFKEKVKLAPFRINLNQFPDLWQQLQLSRSLTKKKISADFTNKPSQHFETFPIITEAKDIKDRIFMTKKHI